MAQSIIKEAGNAGAGILRLFVGQRSASDYFDLSLRGFIGSLIAYLTALALNAYMPFVLGDSSGNPATQRVIMSLIVYVCQMGMAALALHQFKRLDGLIPYMVCDNWTSFYSTILSLLLVIVNFDGDMAVFVLLIAAIAIAVNIARIIVTLSGLQIAGFLVAQMIGVMIAMLILGALFPDVISAQQEMIQSSLDPSAAA